MDATTHVLARLTAAGLTVRTNDHGGLIVAPRDRITTELAALIRAHAATLLWMRAFPVMGCRHLLPWGDRQSIAAGR
jgi:hypothetical protein